MAAAQQVPGDQAHSSVPVDIHIGEFAFRVGSAERDKRKILLLQKRDARVVVDDARKDKPIDMPRLNQLAIGLYLVEIVLVRKGEQVIPGALGGLHHALQELVEDRV